MRKLLLTVGVIAGLVVAPQAKAVVAPTAAVSGPAELRPLLAATGGNLAVGRQPSTGAYGMVRATRSAVLAPGSAATPEKSARTFLSVHGHLLGMSAAEMNQVLKAPVAGRPFARGSELVFAGAEVDKTTRLTRVRFDQTFNGVSVFGGRVNVHIGRKGITAVNGVFVPGIAVARPVFSAEDATKLALEHAAAEHAAAEHGEHGDAAWAAKSTVAEVYNDGLLNMRPAPSRLVWAVELVETQGAKKVMVDAQTGAVINAVELWHGAKDRCVYTPVYVNPNDDDALAVRDEGEPATMVPPLDNLYDFSGQSYDFFANVFGRDSWDGKGYKMRTVYDATAVCPNAYWDGSQKITRFCPGFDVDDVVAHEWGHAYTQGTHGLIYQNQPGALNESYSDIWGEVVDLTNGVDGIGGGDNTKPSPDGVRWVVGEDLGEVGVALGLRDLYNPESRNQPSKVSSPNYICGDGDQGGVHTNSAVPNHAFAMLVDGKTFNGQTIAPIGMTKASHIYYQAMVAYQTPTTGFLEHSAALRASCADLLGIALTPVPGDPAGQAITANDCAQVDKAIAATEMETPPIACGGPLLKPGAPAPCPGGSTLFSEDWETGTDGWEFSHVAADPDRWVGTDFTVTDELPGRDGSAAFAQASHADACAVVTVGGEPVPGYDESPEGTVAMTSPVITAAGGSTTLRFNHYVATEEYDGGNVMISVNGADFVEVPTSAYLFNGPNKELLSGNPKSPEWGWSGVDTGVLTGSWGTSIADLSDLVKDGDTFQLRFEEGQDCTGAVTGWYVDEVAVMSCPIVTPPALSLGGDYSTPDPDGSFTLEWTRPEGATGPDSLEEGVISAPIFADDAESGLGKWVVATEDGAFEWKTATKPGHDGTTFWAQANEASTGVSATMTTAAPVAIPAVGDTLLSFKDWAYNHGGDKLVVEASPDGTAWSQVFQRSTPNDTIGAEAGLVAEELAPRSASLSQFAGQSVFIRFRFTHGPEIYVDVARLGWYVDDIAVSTLTWGPLATVDGTSYTVTGRTTGSYLYRVTTLYGTRPSRVSNTVAAQVA